MLLYQPRKKKNNTRGDKQRNNTGVYYPYTLQAPFIFSGTGVKIYRRKSAHANLMELLSDNPKTDILFVQVYIRTQTIMGKSNVHLQQEAELGLRFLHNTYKCMQNNNKTVFSLCSVHVSHTCICFLACSCYAYSIISSSIMQIFCVKCDPWMCTVIVLKVICLRVKHNVWTRSRWGNRL